MYRRFITRAALCSLAGLAACTDRTPVVPLASAPEETKGENGPEIGDDSWRPGEALSREAARQVPGFGGFSFDTAGNLIIYMRDPGDRSAAGRAHLLLASYHRSLRGGWRHEAAQPKVFVHRAQYSFVELARFRRKVNDLILGTPGVLFTDLDERVNRLAVGLDREQAAAARPAVEGLLARYQIPREAVVFEVRTAPRDACPADALDCEVPCSSLECEEATPDFGPVAGTEPVASAVGENVSIRERVRPIIGGILTGNIVRNRAAEGTLGFIAYYCPPSDITTVYGCGDYYVVTAHQTGLRGTVEGTVFWQPTQFGGDQIGREAIDPPFHTYPFPIGPDASTFVGRECQPPTHYQSVACRRSDMALIQAGLLPAHLLGYIAAPVRRITNSSSYANQFELNPRSYAYKIADEGVAEVGQTVDKIGATTGWRTGLVQRTCVDMVRTIGDPDYQRLARVVYRCQTDVAWAGADEGDSGGPVFKYNNGAVILLGIHHGRGNTGFFWYSPLANIRNDLGLPYWDKTNFRVVAR